MSKKRKLLDDIEMMANYTGALEIELKLAHEENENVNRHLGIANSTVYKLQQHIEMLNRQLEQQDLYITRKDEENKVLKRMYRDDFINNFKGE